MSASSSPNESLSPVQANFVYWFTGLMAVLTSIITPVTLYKKLLRKPGGTDLSRYNDLVQEVGRQLVSGLIGVFSYFGGGELTRALTEQWLSRKPRPMSESDKHMMMSVGATLLYSVGFAVVRPWLSIDLIHFFRKEYTPDGRLISMQEQTGWRKNLVNKVDRIVIKDGVPKLGRAAAFSTGVLAVTLGLTPFFIHGLSKGLSRLLGSKSTSSGNSRIMLPSAGQPTVLSTALSPTIRVPPVALSVAPFYPHGGDVFGRAGTPMAAFRPIRNPADNHVSALSPMRSASLGSPYSPSSQAPPNIANSLSEMPPHWPVRSSAPLPDNRTSRMGVRPLSI